MKMQNIYRNDHYNQWNEDEVEVPSGDSSTNPRGFHGTGVYHDNSSINTDESEEENDIPDDYPILNQHQNPRNDNLVKEGDRARNLTTALVLTGFVFIGYTVFSDAFDQWLYMRFEQQVFGANFSKINVSATKDPCLKSNTTSDKQLDEAQARTSDFISQVTLISMIPAIGTNVFFGAYSDHIGRKIFFIVPMSGLLVQYTVAWIVCNWHLSLKLLYVGFAVNGVCGSTLTLFMALYTYTTDNTDEKKSRSLGMVFVGAFYRALKALSHTAVGYAIPNLGYMWPLATSCLLVLIGLVGTVIFLRETFHRQKNAPSLSIFKGVKTIFSFHIQKPKNLKHKRMDFLILDMVFILYAISTGPTIQTLYLFNEPFCWNSKKIGTMETVVGLLQSFCSVAVVKLLQMFMSDEAVCVIGLISAVFYKLFFAIAQNDFMIYVALALSLMQTTVISLVRAIMSKMVPADKRGSLQSSLTVIQVATVAASGAGFNAVYSLTVSFWKGLTYLIVTFGIAVGVVIMFTYVFIKKRRQQLHN